jgi:hypothetical protein
MLKFGKGNAKIAAHTFNLPAGWYCPFAKVCLSKSNRETGKVRDGKHTEFRCFGATAEARSISLRKSIWHNADLLREAGHKNVHAMFELINASLPGSRLIRVHATGGDFFTDEYFRAWCMVAEANPDVIFYAYTKAVHCMLFDRPANFRLVASRGGTEDNLIEEHGLKEAVVCFSIEEAESKGLEIDHDDTHVWKSKYDGVSFALLLHGTQPAGSDAGKALQKLRKDGWTGYNKKKKVLETA